ncbi:MAG: phosphomannomutase/phosphoglucomutase [Thaumarchaeota archaeon]|nr:phosphomannomutase/phosphoglucomutase [Candidatus Geocrenenecus arthurdayi]
MSGLSMFPSHVFRAYDIRGVYGRDLTDELAKAIALSYASMLDNSGDVLLGRDVRLSGEKLMKSISEGLREGGCNVVNVGIVPTPVSYFGVVWWKMHGGIQITASHNPPEWNGMKLITAEGDTISEGAGMEELRKIVLEGRWKIADKPGVETWRQLIPDYIEFLLSKVKIEKKVRIAVDYSNGATTIVFPRIAELLGIEVIGLNSEPNGLFPAHLPEPTEETLRELQELVRRNDVEFGVGFDGDGDRAVFIDDKGRILPGDIVLGVYVKHLEKKGKVIYDLNSSSALRQLIIENGCEPIESRVGRAYILKEVRRLGAVIGGEKSNHLYFSEVWGFDDAIYAVLKMIEILSKTGKKLSEIVDTIPVYPSTPIMVFDCPDEIKGKVVEKIAEKLSNEGLEINRLDGVKAYFKDGWILIRPSNTMPQIKMSAEAVTEERLREIVEYGKKLIVDAIRSAQ